MYYENWFMYKRKETVRQNSLFSKNQENLLFVKNDLVHQVAAVGMNFNEVNSAVER